MRAPTASWWLGSLNVRAATDVFVACYQDPRSTNETAVAIVDPEGNLPVCPLLFGNMRIDQENTARFTPTIENCLILAFTGGQFRVGSQNF
ncbi:hypothetical protein [Haloparvum sp. PAK95]|uniref:hypothetical protein n=1 Tax=Haloparvum sp. PAK95 TaxID=3418962 RepID=UPI003D2F4F4D